MPLSKTESTLSLPDQQSRIYGSECSTKLPAGWTSTADESSKSFVTRSARDAVNSPIEHACSTSTEVQAWTEKIPAAAPVPVEQEDGRGVSAEEYPEGGLRAWSVVVGSWFAMFACFTFMNTGGVYQAYISTHQLAGYSDSTIGWIFSIYIFLAFFCGIQIGPCFDTKGPFLLVAAGSVCLVVGTFTLAESTKLWHFFLTYSVLCGIGTSLLFTPAIASIAHWFCARRGLATGIACTAGSIGGVVFSLALPVMFERLGFAWGTRIMGFTFIFSLVLANMLMRARLPPKKSPALKDFLPDFRILLEGRYELLFCTIGTFAMEWGLFVPLTYLASWARHTGTGGSNFGYQVLAVISAASFFGRWIPGFIADLIGCFNTIVLACVCCLISLVGFWLPGSIPPGAAGYDEHAWGSVALVVLFAVLFGFGSGSAISLTPVCVGRLCDVRDYGRYYATCYTIVSLGCLTGVPLAGALIQACGGQYTGLVAFTIACYILGIAGYGTARILLVGCRWNAFC